jgi:NAD(P)-dependent dehydrogenase (short-subunit alcohol dehydrogenase family)
MSRILITGSDSGLGAALVEELANDGHSIIPFDLGEGYDVRDPKPEQIPRTLDVLINNAGVNDIGPLEGFTEDRWDRVMDTNAKGIYMMTQACMPALEASNGTVVNIVSNASHMPMTHSLSYNASKGAAHIMTRQLAREFKGRVTVFGISPNKLAGTKMSKYIDDIVPEMRGWSPQQAKDYQLNNLLAGAETPPAMVADFLRFLLQDKEHHRYLSGCIIPYGV